MLAQLTDKEYNHYLDFQRIFHCFQSVSPEAQPLLLAWIIQQRQQCIFVSRASSFFDSQDAINFAQLKTFYIHARAVQINVGMCAHRSKNVSGRWCMS